MILFFPLAEGWPTEVAGSQPPASAVNAITLDGSSIAPSLVTLESGTGV